MALNDAVKIDAKGLLCPEPIRLLHQEIRLQPSDTIIQLEATDPTTTRDVQQFCHFLGHELLASSEAEGVFIFLLRKKGH